MHSGFEIPGIHHRQQQQQPQQQQPDDNENNNNCAPRVLLSMNQTHNILDQIQIQTLPATQQLFLDQHHFFPPQTRLTHHHHYASSSSSPSPFLPVDFKLGLNNSNNEICTMRNINNDNYYNKVDCNNTVSSSINEGGEDANFVRGSEYSSLGMLQCWQNQQDSHAIKQQPFWEPLPSEVSNETSEIIDRQEHLDQMNPKDQSLTNCLEIKSRVHFTELDAIYSSQTRPIEALNTEPNEAKNATKKRKKKKRRTSYNEMINPMSEFIENLVKRVIDHQENLHMKFNEVIERLDLERREREESWRNQELENFEKEAKERAHERFLVENREATIVSYLEKIIGQKINFPTSRD